MATFTVTIPACPGCCDPCDALPDTLQVTVAGFASCGCVNSFPFSAKVTTIIGINGVFSAVWSSTYNVWVIAEMGTYTFESTLALNCTVIDSAVTVRNTGFIWCEDGVLTLRVEGSDSGSYPEDPDNIPPNIYHAFVATGELDETIKNTPACGAGIYTGDGTTLIEIP